MTIAVPPQHLLLPAYAQRQTSGCKSLRSLPLMWGGAVPSEKSGDDVSRPYTFGGSGLFQPEPTDEVRMPWTTSFGNWGTDIFRSASTDSLQVHRPYSFGVSGEHYTTKGFSYPSTYPGTLSAEPKVSQSEDRTMVFASLMMAAEDMKFEGGPRNLPAAPERQAPRAVSPMLRVETEKSLMDTDMVQYQPEDVERLCLPRVIPSSAVNEILLEKIMSLLKNPSKLADIARQAFRMVDKTGRGIDVAGLMDFRRQISLTLGIPDIQLSDASRQHLRFDLHGQGRMQEFDAYLLVKSFLREHCKHLGEYTPGITIQNQSPAESGFLIGDVVGRGNQSEARSAIDREGFSCCIKTYTKATMKPVDVESLKTEFEVLHRLRGHRNIAKAFEIFEDEDFYYMTFELYTGGDFTTLKKDAFETSVPINDDWWRGLFKQCFEGLAYLHRSALMHCDIKESNLMLKRVGYMKPEVVIIDFGYVQGSILDSSEICGTAGYIPPETWGSRRFFPRGDVFAMGVVIMQMHLDKVPPHHDPPDCEVLPGGIFTDGVSTIAAVGAVTKTRTPPFNHMAKQWPVLTQLTRRLLAKDVLKRPCAWHVLQDVWFVSNTQDVLLPRYL